MTYQEMATFVQKYADVIALNRVVSPRVRSLVVAFSFIAFALSIFLLLALELWVRYGNLLMALTTVFESVTPHRHILLLVACLSSILFIFFYTLHTYARYFVLSSVKRIFSKNSDRFPVSYEAAEAYLAIEGLGLIHGLLSVRESNFIINRLLLTPAAIVSLCSGATVNADTVVPEYNETVTLGSLWKLLYENSDGLRKELLANKIQKEIYDDTCDWLDRLLEDEKRQSAWWWRENLSKTRGIGKSLSYGSTRFISKYARELVLDGGMEEVGKVLLHREAIEKLEEGLAKVRGANAVIVGNRGTGRHTVIKMLARMIDQGDCYAEIEHKRVFEFDNNVLGSFSTNEFVEVLSRSLEEALIARNIILVFNDFALISETAEKMGVDLLQLLERYIGHSDISIVCICEQSFYQKESHKAVFDKDFEVIHIEDMNSKLLIPYIQDHALITERMTGKFFPSHSVSVIALALNKYFVEESPLVKASDLLYKMATTSASAGNVVIDENCVSETTKSITGVKTGEIESDEKEKLLNLEAMLHQKVMGQNEAIKVVASTMRRSRAGLVSPNKPIGSFLFLGPTGVGKTETAKTLAEVFFGNEDHMSRIDMNEYTMGNSSYRLIGDVNDEGDLARLLHGRPYGVLLLDEFEKATTDVKDIFLRILDEGVFTNGAGKVISARTQIIIATSNAGSGYIKESGLSPNSTKEEIEAIKAILIDTIVREGLYRPELINRFDAVVVFHPLGDDSRTEIAKKMLSALTRRAREQGYEVTFTDALAQKVLGGEGDVMFGGRAIQRNIQTEVEEALARKIIDGSLRPGDTIVLDSSDLS